MLLGAAVVRHQGWTHSSGEGEFVMKYRHWMNRSGLAALVSSASFLCMGAQATEFDGVAFYTDFGNGSVHSVAYSYNDVSHVFTTGTPQLIATLPGADGIIFAPNGNLLVGGQGTNKVFDVNPNN